ncbi:hypothetical protein AwErysi_07620 [Erysipelotrichaceae bacterium]|nr:hypothetical protein AwErysi_07620 [Erysipelotrichaceae bacterium]
MKDNKYILGLDLGVASIGWGAVLVQGAEQEPYRILDQGVVVFEALDNNKGELYNVTRRQKRGSRRVIRRRVDRLRKIKSLLRSIAFFDEKTYDYKGEQTVYDVKVKGLSEQLSPAEISRALVHYAKNRGFKSNRKVEENTTDKEATIVKTAIGKVHEIKATNNCLLTAALLEVKRSEQSDKITNTTNDYRYSYERQDVAEEATALLEQQQQYYPELTEQWREQYLEILLSQRDFSEGPAEGPYQVSFEKMMGKCSFRPEQTRVVKSAPSYELFVAYQKLQNIRYYERELGYRSKKGLTQEEITNAIDLLQKKTKLTYKMLLDIIGYPANSIQIIDIPSISKDEYKSLIKKFKKDHGVDESQTLAEELLIAFNASLEGERYKKVVAMLPNYQKLQKHFAGNVAVSNLTTTELISVYDLIATILSYAQTDTKIREYLAKLEYSAIPDAMHEQVLELVWKNDGTGNLSTSLVQELVQFFKTGLTYTEAMTELGYEHHNKSVNHIFSAEKFPTVSEIEHAFSTKITQPNVRHVLVILRKLYKEIVATYGVPEKIHIEVARDISNSYEVRNKILKEQIDNRVRNQRIEIMLQKEEIARYLGAKPGYKVLTADDKMRYRLFEEQYERCLYTGEIIQLSQLFTSVYQIDHILPYSQTADDSYHNKVLVSTKANQEKSNRTPHQWLNPLGMYKTYAERIEKVVGLSRQKKEKLLFVGYINREEFTAQSLHATAYVSTLSRAIFAEMLPSDNNQRVKAFKGNLTNYMRTYYNLNRLTHTLESPNMNKFDTKFKLGEVALEFDLKKQDKIKFTLSIEEEYGQSFTENYIINIREDKDTKELRYASQSDKDIHDIAIRYQEEFTQAMAGFAGRSIDDVKDIQLQKLLVDYPARGANYIAILNALLTRLRTQRNRKSRDHNLHHSVDAIIVAILTPTQERRIAKFHQYLQMVQNQVETLHDENGEVITRASLLAEFNYQTSNHNMPKLPLPYEGFVEELTLRIFERNEEILQQKIAMLPGYEGVDIKTIQVKQPYHYYSRKIKRGLHAETIYGVRETAEEKIAVKRIDITKITDKNIGKIYDAKTGQKEVVTAIKTWLADKKPTPYPLLANGRPVKKVRIQDGDLDKLLQIGGDGSKGYAAIGKLARILVYRKKDEACFYFAQIDNYRYLKYATGEDIKLQLWYGQGKNNLIAMHHDLLAMGYELYLELTPGQTIGLQTINSTVVNCKVSGFTSGMLEIKSILGDSYDLIQAQVQKKVGKKQITITVSTIIKINTAKVSLLGEKLWDTDKS